MNPERGTTVPLFVNGGGMRGGDVHYSIEACRSSARHARPPLPVLLHPREFPGPWPVAEGGVSVPAELYEVPLDVIRDRFIPAEPPELELSVIEMDDGSSAVAVVLREAPTRRHGADRYRPPADRLLTRPTEPRRGGDTA